MRRFKDSKSGATIVHPESVQEMVDRACTAGITKMKGRDTYEGYLDKLLDDRSFTGRTFESWNDVRTKFTQHWEEGMLLVSSMMDKIKQGVTLTPKDVRRKMMMNDVEGELDIDKAMRGEPGMYRQAKRQLRVNTRNVALLANIGNVGSYKPEQIFWRGVACSVIIDILEEAGYQCELWVYNTAQNAFGYQSYRYGSSGRINSSTCFTAVKVKSCDDPLNLELTVNVLSSWFHRIIMFGFRTSLGDHNVSRCSSKPILGQFIEHIDLSQGIKNIPVCATAYSEVKAVVAVNEALELVTTQQQDDPLSIYDR